MNASEISVLTVFIVMVAAFALAVFNRGREEKKRMEKLLSGSWGKVPDLTYSDTAAETMKVFSDTRETDSTENDGAPSAVLLDDITWSDLAMDEVMHRVNGTLSSPGEDVLYSWLRHPLVSLPELLKRSKMIRFFEMQETPRNKIRQALAELGRGKRSFYSDARKASEAEPIGRARYILFSLITVFCLVFLFIRPVPAIILIVIDFIVNIAVETQGKQKIENGLSGFGAVLKMVAAAKNIRGAVFEADGAEGIQILKEASDEVEPSVRRLSKVRGASVLGGNADLGAGSAVFTYLNLFFHFDLIIYDGIASALKGAGEDIDRLTEYIGTIDAACAAASFRQSLSYWCLPDLHPAERQPSDGKSVSREQGFQKKRAEGSRFQKAGVEVRGLYHLLLENPVPNDFTASGGNLLTGANASGKSTFLKSVAIAAVLAQSLATVPAASYRAPFFRVQTSMAIRDSLLKGESYFVVEIKSLKRILDRVRDTDPPVLGIVDEVLKGTNTIERIAASGQILSEMARGNGLIIAATHDIELTDMLSDVCANWHFAGEVRDGDVHFTYRIERGATRERNAIALLKMLGYDPELADRAEESAAYFEKTGVWRR